MRFWDTYQALKSGFRIGIVTQGVVRTGDDLFNAAAGKARFCPVVGDIGKDSQQDLLWRPQQGLKVSGDGIQGRSAPWR